MNPKIRDKFPSSYRLDDRPNIITCSAGEMEKIMNIHGGATDAKIDEWLAMTPKGKVLNFMNRNS